MSPVALSTESPQSAASGRKTVGFDPIAARVEKPKFKLDLGQEKERVELAPRGESREPGEPRGADKADRPKTGQRAEATEGTKAAGKTAAPASKDNSGNAGDAADTIDAHPSAEQSARETPSADAPAVQAEALETEPAADETPAGPETAMLYIEVPAAPLPALTAPNTATPTGPIATVPAAQIATAPAAQIATAPAAQITASQTAKSDTPTGGSANQADPVMAALGRLTLDKPAAEPAADIVLPAASALTPEADDKTAFSLPVPWPQPSEASSAAGAKTNVVAANGGKQPRAPELAMAQAAAKSAGETGTTPASTAALSADAKVTVERQQQAASVAKPAAEPVAAAALVAVQQQEAAVAAGRPAVMPLSREETFAALSALNSQTARSNAVAQLQTSPAVVGEIAVAGKPAGQSGQKPAQAAATAAGGAPNEAGAAPAQLPAGEMQTSRPLPAFVHALVEAKPVSAQAGERPAAAASFGADLPAHVSATTGSALPIDASARAEQVAHRPVPHPAASDQVKAKLVKAAQDGMSKIEIQLRPAELGKVEVRLEIGADGKVRGLISAERPETLDLLQRDAKQLERALQEAGLKTDGDALSFELRGGRGEGFDRYARDAGDGAGAQGGAGDGLAGNEDDDATGSVAAENSNGFRDDGSLNLVA